MQVWIDVTYMYTDFGGCGLSGYGDTTTLKNSQISLSDHGLYHASRGNTTNIKILSLNLLKQHF